MERAIYKAIAEPIFRPQNFESVASRVNRILFKHRSLDTSDFLSSFCQREFSFLENEKSLCLLLNHRAEIIYLNRYGCEMLAVEQRSIFGSCWMTRFILPEQRTEVLLIFEQILQGQNQAYRDYFGDIKTDDSNILPIQWKNTILKNKTDQVLGVFSIGCDLLTNNFFE